MHVAFAIDAGYLPWCATAIRSLLDHCDASRLVVHVVHDGTIERHPRLTALRDMVERSGAALELHRPDPGTTSALPAVDRFGSIVWLRFLLPDLLQMTSRVLYLDADTLVTDDLEPLWDADLHGMPIGAVSNVVARPLWEHVHSIGIPDARDFLNSGVLLMDLDRLRAEGSLAALVSTAASRADDLLWPDQDTLNIVFAGRWHHLHPRWNAQNSFWTWAPLAEEVLGPLALAEAKADPAVLHFEGPSVCKPWHLLGQHPFRTQYWDTLRRTPWRDAEPEDRTIATRLISHLPTARQIPMYRNLLRWRQARGARDRGLTT